MVDQRSARDLPGARLLAGPDDALIDVPISLRLEGLPSRILVEIRAVVALPSGSRWTSHAWFVSDRKGVVDLSGDAPVDGTYSRVDPNGLVWSLRHDPASPPKQGSKRFLNEGLQPYELVITVTDASGTELARTIMTRRVVSTLVQRVEVRDDGLYGTLFLPSEPSGVIVVNLPGSDGGTPEQLSALLASRGHASLALAYFGVSGSGLPTHLSRIPLEYFEHAITWIRSHPRLQGARIVLSGTSRGAELALLLGSRNPFIRGVIAWVPSAHLHDGYTGRVGEDAGAAWTHQGTDLPFVRGAPGHGDTTEKGQVLARQAVQHLLTQPGVNAAEIPAEQICGPILLIAGGNDLLWPSGLYARWLTERLHRSHFPYEVTTLIYDGAGHTLGPPINPTTDLELIVPRPGNGHIAFALGGDPAALSAAQLDLWPKVLNFLRTLPTTGALPRSIVRG